MSAPPEDPPAPSPSADPAADLFRIAVYPLAALLLGIALFSLTWSMLHDSPIMLYAGYLSVEHGAVPYRDYFEMNTPGTQALQALLYGLVGASDLRFRILDLLYLAATLAATWSLLRPFGARVAACAACAFGVLYLAFGPVMSLQREYLLLFPLLLGLLALQRRELKLPARAAAASLLFGLAAAVKPHAAVAVLPAAWFVWDELREERRGETPARPSPARLLLLAAAAFLAPTALLLLHLAARGALAPFLEIARSYWPLYTKIAFNHTIVEGEARPAYLARHYVLLGGHTLWLVPAAVGVYLALYRSALSTPQRRRVRLLVGLAAAFSVYPVFAGQFWGYHWLLFLYFAVLLASLCFVPRPAGSPAEEARFAPALLALVLVFGVYLHSGLLEKLLLPEARAEWLERDRLARVNALASRLKERLRPGDRVQPLDWTGGAVHAMLLADARLATPFIYTFHFYHHPDHPYVRELRQRFIRSMETVPPRFVVLMEVTDRPRGLNTTRDFPELERLIRTQYVPVVRESGYVLFERAT